MAKLWTSTVSTESRTIEIFMPCWAGGKKWMEPGSSQLCPVTRGDGHKWEWGRLACSSIGPSSCPFWKWGWHLFSSNFWQLLPVGHLQSKIIKSCLAMTSASSLNPRGCIPSGLVDLWMSSLLQYSLTQPPSTKVTKRKFFILVFNWKWYICSLASRWCLSDSRNTVQALTRTYLLK